MIPDKTLAEWQALADAATPGPWEHGMLPVRPERRTLNVGGWGCGPYCNNTVQAHADGSFIAAARTALPTCIAEIKRLREALQRIAIVEINNHCQDCCYFKKIAQAALEGGK